MGHARRRGPRRAGQGEQRESLCGGVATHRTGTCRARRRSNTGACPPQPTATRGKHRSQTGASTGRGGTRHHQASADSQSLPSAGCGAVPSAMHRKDGCTRSTPCCSAMAARPTPPSSRCSRSKRSQCSSRRPARAWGHRGGRRGDPGSLPVGGAGGESGRGEREGGAGGESGRGEQEGQAVGQLEVAVAEQALQRRQGVAGQPLHAVEQRDPAVERGLDEGGGLPPRVAVVVRDAALHQVTRAHVLVELDRLDVVSEHRCEAHREDRLACGARRTGNASTGTARVASNERFNRTVPRSRSWMRCGNAKQTKRPQV